MCRLARCWAQLPLATARRQPARPVLELAAAGPTYRQYDRDMRTVIASIMGAAAALSAVLTVGCRRSRRLHPVRCRLDGPARRLPQQRSPRLPSPDWPAGGAGDRAGAEGRGRGLDASAGDPRPMHGVERVVGRRSRHQEVPSPCNPSCGNWHYRRRRGGRRAGITGSARHPRQHCERHTCTYARRSDRHD